MLLIIMIGFASTSIAQIEEWKSSIEIVERFSKIISDPYVYEGKDAMADEAIQENFDFIITDAGRSLNVPLEFLKVGEVQPRGWLLKQIKTDAVSGYGPVLDRLTNRCEVEVFDCRNKTMLNKPKGGEVWWNGETTGNWLDGLIRTAYLSGDTAAKHQVDGIVDRILSMQEDDGYLGTYPKSLRFEQPIKETNGELWSQTCLFRGLLAYYELTGLHNVLEAVERAAKLMMSKYSPDKPYWGSGKLTGGPGHNLMFVDVCEWLFRLTGDQVYVEFAQFLYDTYSEAPQVRETDIQLQNLSNPDLVFSGHGAHVMEHLRVPLFVYYSTGNTKYRTAVENCFVKALPHLNAGGAVISDEAIAKRPGSAYIGCEYCTMLEWLSSLQSGVQKTGDVKLADRIEVLAYNAAEGARQHDGKAIQYCTRDNQLKAIREEKHGRFKLSPTHEDVAVCCPVNALKFFPYFTSCLWMKTTEKDGLAAVNYAPNQLETYVKGVAVHINSETNYPFDDKVQMTINPAKPVTFIIRLRKPGWKGRVNVKAPGASISQSGDWIVLEKEWRTHDRIILHFTPAIEPKTMVSGEIYWQRGPLVFTLPIPAEKKGIKTYSVEGFADYDYTPLPGTVWEYFTDVNSSPFNVKRMALNGDPWKASPILIKGRMHTPEGKPVKVTLVPYGSTILRWSTFPLSGEE